MKQVFNKQWRIIIFLIFFGGVLCVVSHAQTITYSYDASGNCTSRHLVRGSEETQLKSSNANSKDGHDVPSSADETVLLLTEENSITVYPNPTNGQFQVELKGYDDVLSKGIMTIYSSQGKVVLKMSSLQQINSVNLNNQNNGSYVIHIHIDGDLVTHKLIIER